MLSSSSKPAQLSLLSLCRGDHKKSEKRKPIAAKLIAGMLEVAGVQQVTLTQYYL